MTPTALLLVLAALLLVACGGSPSHGGAQRAVSAALTPAEVPGMAAEVVRLRTDEAVGGRVQVRLTATGNEPFTVAGVALDSPGFRPLPPAERRTEFAPGRTIDLPTPYGEPVCERPAAPVAALLTVVRPDGRAEQVRVPLSGDALELVHAEECAARRVSDVVDITVTDLRPEEGAVVGVLRLTRRSGEEPVVVADLGRSVLLEPTAEGLPLRLAAEQASSRVSFRPVTCDSHVLAESKKSYIFPVRVTIGEADPVTVDLPVDGHLRAALAGLVDRVCGAG